MTIAPERSEAVFQDYKKAYNQDQATAEANRCLFCSDAPCIKACPTHIDIPQFIRKIATGNVKGSAKTIFDANILGMSCARVCPVEVLCVGDCVYNDLGQSPIQIGKLQRYATDKAFEEKWRFFVAGAPTGKSVALVGAGPASLACAHELRRQGHACTIYEKRSVLGGLNTTGVAPYKMRADRSYSEVEWVLGIGGVNIQTGVSIGENLSWDDLEAKHDAVFIGAGLGPDTTLAIDGASLKGVYGAVDFIERFKLNKLDLSHVKQAVVIGGGNTAVDAVRELIGLGVAQVTMLYRGDEEKMSGYEHEWEAALIQGARAIWRAQPVAFEGAGEVSAIRYVSLDESRTPIPDSEQRVSAELVLLAIGQSKLGEMVKPLAGIKVNLGRIVVDEDGFTGRPKYYAGGDCANGGKEVVNAAAEGKRAAKAIHQAISK
jgi:dihydropyrimidine dehydrogenase (NAD+) subunit PreT